MLIPNEIRLMAMDLNSKHPVPYVPLYPQRLFHQSKAKYRAFIGGLGYGKSYACGAETIIAAILNPGSFNAVVRWDQNSLKDTTWLLLEQIMELSGLEGLIKLSRNNKQESYMEFYHPDGRSQGSIIQGFHAKNWKKFGSLSLSSFFIDESHELEDADVWNQLSARVSRHHIGPNRGWMAGLSNLRDWRWEKFISSKKLPNHECFLGTTFDNPYLQEGYAEELILTHGQEVAQMMIMGSFDSVEGRLWSNFNYDTHVLRRVGIPKEWPRYAAIDPGFGCDPMNTTDTMNRGDPAGMVRIVADPYGNYIVEGDYREYDRLTEEFSRDILAINKDNPPSFYVMDNSAFRNTHASRYTVEEVARREGINPMWEAKNTAGYLNHAVPRIRSLLTPQPGRIHPITKQEGTYPALYFFEDCVRTITEVQNCRRKKQGAASAANDIKLMDHGHDLVDCLLFLSLESLQPAEAAATKTDPYRWYKTIDFDDGDDKPIPYLEQVSRIKR